MIAAIRYRIARFSRDDRPLGIIYACLLVLLAGAAYVVVHAFVRSVFASVGILMTLFDILDTLALLFMAIAAVAAVIVVIVLGVGSGRDLLEQRQPTNPYATSTTRRTDRGKPS